MGRFGRLELTYYSYQGALTQGFIVPIVVEYVLWRGMSYGELGLLGGTFMLTWVGCEIPTGYLADRWGRRRLLLGSSLLTAGAIGALAFVTSFGGFLVIYVTWAIAVSLRSGVGSAWLYDVLEERFDAAAFTRVTGHGTAVFLGAGAITAVLGARLAVLDWRYPFVANAITMLTSVIVLARLPDSRSRTTGDTPHDPRAMIDAIRGLLSGRLGWFVLYTACFFGFVEVTATFTQPVSTDVGVPLHGLGWLYATFNVVGALASASAGRVRTTIGIAPFLAIAPIAVGLSFVVPLARPAAAIPGFLLARAAWRLARPLQHQYLNDRVGSTARATLVSTATMAGGLSAAASRVAGGWLADAIGPRPMLATFGVGLAALSLAVLAVAFPFDRPTESIAPAFRTG